jgi:carboxylesterase type B
VIALRGEPATALIASGDQLTPPRGLNPDLLWGQAIVDGWVLPRPPLEVFAAAQQAHVPLIIGNNTLEFSLGGGPDAARAVINGPRFGRDLRGTICRRIRGTGSG